MSFEEPTRPKGTLVKAYFQHRSKYFKSLLMLSRFGKYSRNQLKVIILLQDQIWQWLLTLTGDFYNVSSIHLLMSSNYKWFKVITSILLPGDACRRRSQQGQLPDFRFQRRNAHLGKCSEERHPQKSASHLLWLLNAPPCGRSGS
jgi:hypothetical protein